MKGFRAALGLCAALALAGCAPPDEAAVGKTCGRGPGFDYCVHPGSEIVLYYLHGAGQSHRSWETWSVARGFEREFEKKGVAIPTVVSVSFGKYWILKKGEAADRFLEGALPYIEKRIGVPRTRWLWGLSMGGFNAAQLLLRRPELWKTAVLSCPAITILSPYAPKQKIDSFIARNGADARKVRWMLGFSRRAFTEREWPENDPFVLAKTALDLPPVFVECGDRDEYGFFEGSRRFADAVGAKFHAVSGGGHCVVTREISNYFLAAASKG